MISFLSSVFGFVVLLSIVVFVHELGHFTAGRMLGLGIERFALGFGRALFKRTRNGIEYRLNWIPFGGYVKFVGDEPGQPVPDELRAVAFNTAPVYKRAITVAAGPMMNVVLAVVLFCLVYLVGQPNPTTLVGNVEPDSPAAKAGLRAGDRIVAVDGDHVEFWEQLSKRITENPGRQLRLLVDRGGKPLAVMVTPNRVTAMNIFGFDSERGSIGVSQTGPKAWIGVTSANSPAHLAGLRTGDLILTVNGQPIHFLADLDRVLAAQNSGPLTITVARGEDNITAAEPPTSFTAQVPAATDAKPWSAATLGVEAGEFYVQSVVDGSPAQKAGLQIGDRLLALNGAPVTSWDAFATTVRENAGKSLVIDVRRNWQTVRLNATPEKKTDRDLLGKVTSFGRLGLSPQLLFSAVDTKIERYYNPGKIIVRGLGESWHWTAVTVKGFFYLIIGKAPATSLGGPILIAQLAGESARMGWIPFVFFMAVISLNLAFINLFPIPVLDGGFLFLLTIEGVRRRPLSDRAVGIAQRVGLTLIGALILLVFYNDLSRVWFDLKDRFFG